MAIALLPIDHALTVTVVEDMAQPRKYGVPFAVCDDEAGSFTFLVKSGDGTFYAIDVEQARERKQ